MSIGLWNNISIDCAHSRILVGSVLAAACIAWPVASRAASPHAPEVRSDGTLTADGLVAEALIAEVDGRGGDRARWAQAALKEAPTLPDARWLDGQVRVNGQWTTIDKAPSLIARDHAYKQYLVERSQHADTADSQYELGEWCAKRRLKEQARTHFARAVQLDPDHAAARSRLGYTHVAGQWQSVAQLRHIEAQRKRLQDDYTNWKPRVDRIWKGLARRDSESRLRAIEQLKAIDSPAAVPALELLLGSRGEEEGILAAETIGRIGGPEASLWLARLATVSRFDKVRNAAVKELKSRPLVEFVPAVLAEMRTPVEVSTKIGKRTDGTTVVRQTSLHETQDAVEESIRERRFWTSEYVAPDAAPETFDLFRALERLTCPMVAPGGNARIADVLNQVTNQHLSSDAKVWWSWWDEYNEFLKDPKPVVHRSSVVADLVLVHGNEEQIVRRYEHDEEMVLRSRERYEPLHHSCFAAGTPVWTIDGPRPVERIAVGDLVLSQNVETGELAYKPVLRTTIGSPVELVSLKTGEETFRCTGGHAFWVPGDGWTHARKLDSQTRVHGVSGATVIDSVGPGPKVKTYNMVVADWNTYFVGRGKLLVHDITLPSPTTTEVPGLKTP